MIRRFSGSILPAILLCTGVALLGCEIGPKETEQLGFRGTAMQQVSNPELAPAAPEIPAALPDFGSAGPRAGDVYQNVEVLNDLAVPQFTRIMQAMTSWVAPEEGCAYCHANGEALSSDALYTKVVARRMLQMTRALNDEWGDHVGNTGVTCYTCHRGNNVPQYTWSNAAAPSAPKPFVGNRAGQNRPSAAVGQTSLPDELFAAYFNSGDDIRVLGEGPLPIKGQQGASILATEQTYGLMMHLSSSLGVNCTYCHNSRAFAQWDQSSPARTKAWYGIRMVRDINSQYLESVQGIMPASSLGPQGDVKKVNCMSCHQGASKPLNGAQMAADYPELTARR